MVDHYTKAILTVIATALVALVMQGAIGQSRAQYGAQKVEICSGFQCAGLVPYDITVYGRTSTHYALPVIVQK